MAFARTVRTLVGRGHRYFVEVGPHPDSAEPGSPSRSVTIDMLATVRSAAAAVTGDPDPLAADASFRSQGFTWLLAVDPRNRLERELDRPLPMAILLGSAAPDAP